MLRILGDIQPGKKRMLSDLLRFRQEMKADKQALIPFIKDDELALVSLNIVDQKKTGFISKIIKGAITTIYHEKAIIFAIKEYFSASKRKAIYLGLNEIEFDYLTRGKNTEVFVNREHIGTIDQNGILYAPRRKKILAKVIKTNDEYFDVFIEEKEVGSMLNPMKVDKYNPRAFQLLENLDGHQTVYFLVLCLFEILHLTVLKDD